MRIIMLRGITLIVAILISLTFVSQAALDTTKLPLISNGAGNRAYWGAPFYWTSNIADFTGTDVNTAQPVFEAARDTFAVTSDTTYLMEGVYHIETTGTSSHTLGLLFEGTAVVAECEYGADSTNAATEVLGATNAIWITVPTVIPVTAAVASATHHTVFISGTVRITTAGTFIPKYQWSAAPGAAGVVKKGSWFKLTPVGTVATGMSTGVS